jgi:hypothetical protein
MRTLAWQQGRSAGGVQAWLNIPAPQPLEGPGGFERFVLEQPWLGAGALALLAGVLFFALRGAGRLRPAVGLLGALLGLACAVLAAGLLVTTPREAMRRATRSLIASIARGDSAGLDGVLAPGARLVYFLAPQGIGKGEILSRVREQFAPSGVYAVKSWSIEELQAQLLPDGRGVSQVLVSATPANQAYAFPVKSWWRIDWERATDAAGMPTWRASGLMPVAISGVENAGG